MDDCKPPCEDNVVSWSLRAVTVSGGQQGSRSPDIKFQRLGSSMTGAEEERRRITNTVGDRRRQGAELLYLK